MSEPRRWTGKALVVDLAARLLAGYLRLCYATTRWEIEGAEDYAQAAREGATILVMWHSRILLAPAIVERLGLQVTTLRDPSPAGQLSAAVQRRFGMEPLSMDSKSSNRITSRRILRRLKSGGNLGLTADGPKGPARVMRTPPLEWARNTGAPVYLFAFSTSRQSKLNNWDKMLFPKPFSRGAARFSRWETDVPRKADAADLQALCTTLGEALDAVQVRVDEVIGLTPGP